MSSIFRPRLSALTLLAASAASVGLLASQVPAFAEGREPMIHVSGTGDIKVAPDMAWLSLGVVRQAKTAAGAVKADNEAMAQVLDALKKEGIGERDMQTSDFSVQPLYKNAVDKNGQSLPPEIIGYQANNSLSVKVKDLKKLGGLIDKTVELGVNDGGNIRFDNEDKAPIEAEARKQAVKAALDKARAMAEAAGVKLGTIIDMSEVNAPPMPMPMAAPMALAKAMDAAPVPVAAGENSYRVSVNLSIALINP